MPACRWPNPSLNDGKYNQLSRPAGRYFDHPLEPGTLAGHDVVEVVGARAADGVQRHRGGAARRRAGVRVRVGYRVRVGNRIRTGVRVGNRVRVGVRVRIPVGACIGA